MARAVHIVGAGLAGLSAAVRLSASGAHIVVHEAANQAGGRCRSYHDPALGMTIDNGNHLVLSGNRATLDYLRLIGAQERLIGPPQARFPFLDLATGERWTLQPSDGGIPWWVFDPRRRVPGTRAWDYAAMLRLVRAAPGATIGDVLPCRGPLYDRLLRPVLLAALNTEPREASAELAGAVVRETLTAGGAACRPLIARDGLSGALVQPALDFIAAHGGTVHFGHRLRALSLERRAEALDFGDQTVPLAADDAVVLAVPPPVAVSLLPGLAAPSAFRAIVNAHFRLVPPPQVPPITGVVNGLVEWLFAFPDRLAVTISAADRLLDVPREMLASQIWRDVARIADIAQPMPPWQIVRERRATFAALPQEDARRPAAETSWSNLVLAGDWTATGLPATIESAVRSGRRAADLIAGRA
jgi:squalene-associated FAD-dependent desaturase